jgi:hypothetical protein
MQELKKIPKMKEILDKEQNFRKVINGNFLSTLLSFLASTQNFFPNWTVFGDCIASLQYLYFVIF